MAPKIYIWSCGVITLCIYFFCLKVTHEQVLLNSSLENSYINRSTVGLVNASTFLFKLIDVKWPLKHIWTREP